MSHSNSDEKKHNNMNQSSNTSLENLISKSSEIRKDVVEISIAHGGHAAASLSCVEIMVTLYYSEVMNISPNNINDDSRDRYIHSKGHAVNVLYSVLSDRGFFPREWINKYYRKGDCRLGGHPDKDIPGVEVTTGAIGHGLGMAGGMALSAKMDCKKHFHFVLMGDAECTEGSVWEAALSASYHKLSNIIAIIDNNAIGASDFLANYSSLDKLEDKWKSFGWNAVSCDGHNIKDLESIFKSMIKSKSSKPNIVIANTIKGKGVTFLENHPKGHVMGIDTESKISQARKDVDGLQ